MNEVGSANDQNALVVAHGGRVASSVFPCFGLALLLNDFHELVGLFGLARTLGIFAGVAYQSAAAARAAARTTAAAAESATTSARAAAAESAATSAGAATAAATRTAALALRKRGAEVEVRSVVEHRWLEHQIAHRIHPKFTSRGDRKSVLGSDLDEALAQLPSARSIGAANFQHALDDRQRGGAVHVQRNFELSVDALRAALARVTDDERNATEMLGDEFKGSARGRLVEVHRDIAVEQRAEKLAATGVVLRRFLSLIGDGANAFGKSLRTGLRGRDRGNDRGDNGRDGNERDARSVLHKVPLIGVRSAQIRHQRVGRVSVACRVRDGVRDGVMSRSRQHQAGGRSIEYTARFPIHLRAGCDFSEFSLGATTFAARVQDCSRAATASKSP